MDLSYFAFRLWEWVVSHGIPLGALFIIALLIPRLGRLAVRMISNRLDREEESTKARLALLGALVYVLQTVAYFVVIVLALSNLGVPPLGAAIPATVVSAAIGFGAQNVIGDFLAGFFIISERQFGVGDYVSFDGTSDSIEGTVISLTLRATKVRTAGGELVTIPNGSAGVITNFSQEWSRAVVDLDIPLQVGESMDDLVQRVEDATAAAVTDPAVAEDITGEIQVLPATSISAPTVAGQPWQVKFRVTVVVNPARQWAVERVLRAALLNDFWDRYDMPAWTNPSANAPRPAAPAPAKQPAKRPAAARPAATLPVAAAVAAGSPALATPAAAQSETARLVSDGTATDSGPGASPDDRARAEAAAADEQGNLAKKGENAEGTASAITNDGEEEHPTDSNWLQRTLSLGGRTRASTTGLVLSLFVLGGLALASSNPDGAEAGWLSPDKWRPAATSKAPTPTQPTPASTEPAQSAVPTATATAPTATSASATPTASATPATTRPSGTSASVTSPTAASGAEGTTPGTATTNPASTTGANATSPAGAGGAAGAENNSGPGGVTIPTNGAGAGSGQGNAAGTAESAGIRGAEPADLR